MVGMNILLIGSAQTSDDIERYYGEYSDFFMRGAARSSKEVNFQWTLFDDLYIAVGDDNFEVFDTKSSKDLAEYDLILVRGKGLRQLFDVVRTVSRYAVAKGVPIVNDYSGFRDSSKLAQALQFHETGLPVSSTVYVNTAITEGRRELPFAYPCVMKAVHGAHGNDNYVVHSVDDVRRIAEESSSLRFVLQRFVPNDSDYRILVVGNETAVIERKAIEGSHLNNTSQGGSAELLAVDSVPRAMIDDAIKITRHLDMTIAGVDALIDSTTGEYFFLEVNSQPQLMSGAFVDQKEILFGRYLDSFGA